MKIQQLLETTDTKEWTEEQQHGQISYTTDHTANGISLLRGGITVLSIAVVPPYD